jgi:hypothetical protein
MAVTVTYSNHFKYALFNKQIDINTDSIKVLLMRDGFLFDKAVHGRKKNIICNSGSLAVVFDAATKTITRAAGSFVTDGFVVGNRITTDAALNPGPFIITDVSALIITVGETVLDESVTKTITANDELTTGAGYTADTKALTTLTLTEDDVNNRAECTFDTVIWIATGGSIGPTPCALIYDNTDADKSIILCIGFGQNETALDGNPFTISGGKFRVS